MEKLSKGVAGVYLVVDKAEIQVEVVGMAGGLSLVCM